MATDFEINDAILWQEARELAREIFDECTRDMADDETPETYRGDMSDRAHEAADRHNWVIYTYKARKLCANCDTQRGEEFLDDVGPGENPTYDSLGTLIAYGELRGRIEEEIQDLVDAWEESHDGSDDE